MKPLIVSILLSLGAAKAAPIYNITDLGSLGGWTAAAYAISPNGEAVGGAMDPFNTMHAFRAPGGAMTPFAANAVAWDVNASGQIAGVQYVGNEAYAARWSHGALEILGDSGSYAMGINASGQVTGMWSNGHLLLTDAAGNPQSLGTMPGSFWSAGYDVNDSGQVAGYAIFHTTFQAFLWSEAGGYQPLASLGGANSYAMAVNNLGAVAGHAQNASGAMRAALWWGGTVTDLGALGGTQSYAYDINNARAVVGHAWVNGQARAFLYTGGVMLDLTSLLADGAGWVLQHAYGINDAGQIVGMGLYNGQMHAFRLDPAGFGTSGLGLLSENDGSLAVSPEPASWMLAAVGVALLLAARSRRLRR